MSSMSYLEEILASPSELREILLVEPTIQRPLKYSEVPITFSREDQWTSFSEPRKFPLVLDPVVQGSKLTRVLIDGGSELNLIFASTLVKMGLNYMSLLTPSKAPFYGTSSPEIPLRQLARLLS